MKAGHPIPIQANDLRVVLFNGLSRLAQDAVPHLPGPIAFKGEDAHVLGAYRHPPPPRRNAPHTHAEDKMTNTRGRLVRQPDVCYQTSILLRNQQLKNVMFASDKAPHVPTTSSVCRGREAVCGLSHLRGLPLSRPAYANLAFRKGPVGQHRTSRHVTSTGAGLKFPIRTLETLSREGYVSINACQEPPSTWDWEGEPSSRPLRPITFPALMTARRPTA